MFVLIDYWGNEEKILLELTTFPPIKSGYSWTFDNRNTTRGEEKTRYNRFRPEPTKPNPFWAVIDTNGSGSVMVLG